MWSRPNNLNRESWQTSKNHHSLQIQNGRKSTWYLRTRATSPSKTTRMKWPIVPRLQSHVRPIRPQARRRRCSFPITITALFSSRDKVQINSPNHWLPAMCLAALDSEISASLRIWILRQGRLWTTAGAHRCRLLKKECFRGNKNFKKNIEKPWIQKVWFSLVPSI